MDQYSSEESAIKRRQAIAQMLMQQGSEPLDTNQVAGGYVVPVSPLAGVAKVAQQLAGAYMGKKADERDTALQDKRMKDLTSIDINSPEASNKLMAQGRVTEAIALQKDANKVNREGVPTGFTQQTDGTIAPMPIAGGTNYMDLQLKLANQKAQIPSYGEPEKLDMARENQVLQRDAARRAEEAAARADAAGQRQEAAALRQEQAAKDAKLQNVPAVHRMAYTGNQASINQIDEAINAIEASPGHLGMQNILGDSINQRLDPEGVTVRAKLGEVAGVKRHDLSGAAISASEAPNLAPFIPSVKDNDKAAIEKLKSLRDNLMGINSGIEGMYSTDEYRNPIKPQVNPPTDAKHEKVTNPRADIDALRKDGQVDEANQLEDMVNKDQAKQKNMDFSKMSIEEIKALRRGAK